MTFFFGSRSLISKSFTGVTYHEYITLLSRYLDFKGEYELEILVWKSLATADHPIRF